MYIIVFLRTFIFNLAMMESKLYAVVLVIFAVVDLGNCVPDVQELTKTIENMQKKITSLQTSFLHLESENRKIRKELDKQNNRTTDLETKFDSALSSFPATADNVSKGKIPFFVNVLLGLQPV